MRLLKIGMWLCGALVAGVLLLHIYVVWSTRALIYQVPEKLPKEQVALVLGASIHSNGTLSRVLQERADGALMLYKKGKVSKILVTGDNSTIEHNEVYPVGKYLVGKGVPPEDIFLDYAGFDTYSSVYRAKHIFGVTSMIVVSQNFHLPRAIFIARALGVSVVGFDAALLGDTYTNNALREVFATTKAAYDLLIKRTPRYMGATFSVGGDGSETWVGPKVKVPYFERRP